MTPTARHRQGIVLPLVLIIALLLSAAILTFVRRSVVDSMVVRNRDASAAAAALARGGIRLGTAIVVHDRLERAQVALSDPAAVDVGNTLDSLWAQVGELPHETDWGGVLQVSIEDSGSKFNLNALVPSGVPEGPESQPEPEAEEFLVEFLERILDEMEFKSDDRVYDPREMARNLLDYMDIDDVAIGGRDENDYYLRQNPPYRAANRPLLSVEEIAMVEGFDTQLMEAMRPYVTVHPLVGDEGINMNTAPPHVLSLVYHGSGGNMSLAGEDPVREIMQARSDGAIVCDKSETAPECVTLAEVGLGVGSIFPPVALPSATPVFTIRSEARVLNLTRTIEAVVDLTDEQDPKLLSWHTL